MQLHPNAKTTPRSRLEIVQRLWNGERPQEVAEAFGLSVRTI
jgi:Trp operon repressor